MPVREGRRLRAGGRCADGGVASDGVRWRRREQTALEACPVRSNDPLPVDRKTDVSNTLVVKGTEPAEEQRMERRRLRLTDGCLAERSFFS